MRVLVLRPKAQGVRTARALARLGHEAVARSAPRNRAIEEARLPLPRIRIALRRGDRGKPQRLHAAGCRNPGEARRRCPRWWSGRARRARPKRRGFAPCGRSYRTARELALALPEQAPRGRLLYLAGRDRRPEIEEALRQAKRGFDIVEVYAATVLPALPLGAAAALRHREIDAVLHYSARSAQAYVTLAKATGFCRAPSPRVSFAFPRLWPNPSSRPERNAWSLPARPTRPASSTCCRTAGLSSHRKSLNSPLRHRSVAFAAADVDFACWNNRSRSCFRLGRRPCAARVHAVVRSDK